MKIHAILSIFSDHLSGFEIEEKIGIVGDYRWNKGDIRPQVGIIEVENGWQIKAVMGDPSIDGIPDKILLINELKNRVAQKNHIIRALKSSGCTIQLSLITYRDYFNPQIILKNEIISWLDQLNASLNTEFYVDKRENEGEDEGWNTYYEDEDEDEDEEKNR